MAKHTHPHPQHADPSVAPINQQRAKERRRVDIDTSLPPDVPSDLKQHAGDPTENPGPDPNDPAQRLVEDQEPTQFRSTSKENASPRTPQ